MGWIQPGEEVVGGRIPQPLHSVLGSAKSLGSASWLEKKGRDSLKARTTLSEQQRGPPWLHTPPVALPPLPQASRKTSRQRQWRGLNGRAQRLCPTAAKALHVPRTAVGVRQGNGTEGRKERSGNRRGWALVR